MRFDVLVLGDLESQMEKFTAFTPEGEDNTKRESIKCLDYMLDSVCDFGFLSKSDPDEEYVSLPKSDIDLDGMVERELTYAGRVWDYFQGIIDGKTWKTADEVRQMFPDDEDNSKFREFYRSQEPVALIKRTISEEINVQRFSIDDLQLPVDEFCENHSNRIFNGFMSVVQNGVWHDNIKGQLVEDMIRSLDDDQMVSVISCKL